MGLDGYDADTIDVVTAPKRKRRSVTSSGHSVHNHFQQEALLADHPIDLDDLWHPLECLQVFRKIPMFSAQPNEGGDLGSCSFWVHPGRVALDSPRFFKPLNARRHRGLREANAFTDFGIRAAGICLLGRFATRAGGIMASENNFVIEIKGRGAHAASAFLRVIPGNYMLSARCRERSRRHPIAQSVL
jgi:hypothetical protein